MSRLDLEARLTFKTLKTKTSKSAIARLLDVTEGAVRYHVGRIDNLSVGIGSPLSINRGSP